MSDEDLVREHLMAFATEERIAAFDRIVSERDDLRARKAHLVEAMHRAQSGIRRIAQTAEETRGRL